jgi:hypothetical protein
MPKVAQQVAPTVETEVTRGPQARDLPISAFGASSIGKGIGDLGRGLAQMSDRINTTSAEEAMVKFERAKNELFFNPESGYFNTQGKSAYDLSSDANDSLQKLAREHADGMSNAQARDMFTRVAERHVTSGQADIMRHATKGAEAWEIATIDAQVENTIENAALFRGDDKKLAVQRQLGRQAVLEAAELKGITGDALNEQLQTFEGSFAFATIDAAILDNASDGRKALDKYGDRLEGPDKAKFDAKITAKEQEEQTQSDAQEAVTTANKLVGEHDGNRTAVLESISKLDDDAQPAVRKEAMYQINQLETAETEERADIYKAAEGFITGGGSAESFKATQPDQWSKLSLKQQRALEKNEPIENDWNVWHDTMSKSDEEIKKMSPDEVERRAMKLDDSHRDKLYTLWRKNRTGKSSGSDKAKSQVGRTRSTQVKSAVEQLMNKNTRKFNAKNKARADQFYALFDSEHENRKNQLDRELTSEEFTDMVNGFTRKVTIEKDFWPDPERGVEDIPEEHLGELTQFLRDNNVVVTSENLVRAYEQAK